MAVSTVAPPDPKWLQSGQKTHVNFSVAVLCQGKNWPYPLCSQRLIFFALAYHHLLPSEILVCFQPLQASGRCVFFSASIWPHPMLHKHLENLSAPWSRLGTGPPDCSRWSWLACEVRSKVKCVLNVLHFGEGIGVTKVAVREGAPGV